MLIKKLRENKILVMLPTFNSEAPGRATQAGKVKEEGRN
jgi:hypothetical protein